MMPSVSVIIPVYNAERFLRECLKSVLGQVGVELEVLCVDDGSCDSSLAILNEIAAKDKRVIVMSQANGGPAKARNLALDRAQGDYVSFMDADDAYPFETTLSELVRAAEEAGAELAAGEVEVVSEQGVVETTAADDAIAFRLPADRPMLSPRDYPSDQGFWRLLYRRDLFANGLRFPELRGYEDPPLLAQALARATSVAIVPRNVYRYRLVNRPKGHRAAIPLAKLRDYVCGLTLVLETSSRGGLTRVYQDVARRVMSDEFRDELADWPIKSPELMGCLCRLQAALKPTNEHEEAPLLPVLETICRQARFGVKVKRVCYGAVRDFLARLRG